MRDYNTFNEITRTPALEIRDLPPLEFQCKICGAMFKARTQPGKAKYCSVKCKNANQARKARELRMRRTK